VRHIISRVQMLDFLVVRHIVSRVQMLDFSVVRHIISRVQMLAFLVVRPSSVTSFSKTIKYSHPKSRVKWLEDENPLKRLKPHIQNNKI
jgi:hypothetical protein